MLAGIQSGVDGRRLIGFLLALAVFFLPLHFHAATATAKVTHECSCVQGTRSQMAAAPVAVDWLPALRIFTYETFSPRLFTFLVVSFQPIRAPPAF